MQMWSVASHLSTGGPHCSDAGKTFLLIPDKDTVKKRSLRPAVTTDETMSGCVVEVIHTTIQQEGFHQEQIHWNEQTSRVCLVETNGGRSTDHSSPPGRRLMQTCVIIRTPFISLLMIAVPALGLYCLFGWEHKRYALILYSSIVEPAHCTCECSAKWAQLRRAMPPRERTDEGLKLGRKEQSKATCCLLYVPKNKLQRSPQPQTEVGSSSKN